MNGQFEQILGALKDLSNRIDGSEERIAKRLEQIVTASHQQIKHLKSENKILKEKLENQELKIKVLEDKGRKNNVVVIGLEEKESNINELDQEIKEIIRNDLKIAIEDSHLNFTVRLGKKHGGSRPVLVAFSTWSMKREVIKNKWMLKNTNIVIKEDLSKELREERRELGTFMLKLREEGKLVSVRGNKIFMEGKYYSKEELQDLHKNKLNELRERNEPNDCKRQRSEEKQTDSQAVFQATKKNNTSNNTGIERSNKITSFFGLQTGDLRNRDQIQ